MAIVFMYVGVSGCGKTYCAYRDAVLSNEDAVVLDSDKIRGELFDGDESCQADNALVFQTMEKKTLSALGDGRNVYYVATNLNAKRRRNFILQIKKKFPDTQFICRIVVAPPTLCYERNNARERHVPDYVIDRQLRQFQIPTLTEGFNSIAVKKNCSDEKIKQFATIMWNDVDKIEDQKNPHHTLSLYQHMLKTIEKIKLNPQNKETHAHLLIAAGLHDVGKAYTQSFDDNGIAHYYGHECVSAWIALCLCNDMYIAQLIGWHMYPFNNNKPLSELFPNNPEFVDDVMRLHEADMEAK